MKPKNEAILEKILDEISVSESFIRGVDKETFLADEKIKRAVCMTIINIGELVKNIDDDYRIQHANIPWKAIAGFRDIAAHKYQTLRMDDVYLTATSDLPDLKEMIQDLLDTDKATD